MIDRMKHSSLNHTLGHILSCLTGLVLGVSFLLPSVLAASLTGLRDSTLWVRGTDADVINLSYKDWYAGDSTTNYIYFHGPDGELLNQITADPTAPSGQFALSLSRGDGDYRIELPGYFHRQAKITVPETVSLMLEPAKYHFSLHPEKSPLYFNVTRNVNSFTLCGRYFKGASAIDLFDFRGRKEGTLTLSRSPGTLAFDTLPVEFPTPGTWRIEFQGRGKVGFWLDGIPNLFAPRPGDLFVPELKPGTVRFTGNGQIAPMGLIGAFMVLPSKPPEIFEQIKYMGLQSFNYYIDHEWREPANPAYPLGGDNDDPDTLAPLGFKWEDRRIEFYRQELEVQVSSIFDSKSSWLGIPKATEQQREFAEFTLAYIRHFNEDASQEMKWFSPWDEPNLKEFTLDQYVPLVQEIGKRLKSEVQPNSVRQTPLLAITSSGLEGSNQGPDRIGSTWMARLYTEVDAYVDGIAFNYWDRKDLCESWRFRNAVSTAADIMATHDSDGRAVEEIVINQTSMSPGTSSSPYDVNTHFGALWLTGAICNGFADGLLGGFHYFTTVDDRRHMKGLIYGATPPSPLPYTSRALPFEIKPMGHAMAMINGTLLDHVVVLDNTSLEVDALLTLDTRKRRLGLIAVNKFNRSTRMEINTPLPEGFSNLTLSVSAQKLDSSTPGSQAVGQSWKITLSSPFVFTYILAPQTLYSFSFE